MADTDTTTRSARRKRGTGTAASQNRRRAKATHTPEKSPNSRSAQASVRVAKTGRPASRKPEPPITVVEPEVEEVRSEIVSETGPQMPDLALRQQLTRELEELVKRLRSFYPGYGPSALPARSVFDMIEESADKIAPGLKQGVMDKLRAFVGEDLFDVDTWKGMLYMLNSTLEYQTGIVKRRLTGEYETDEWGLDREVLDAVRPFFEFMYKTYWRVQMMGVENIPGDGRALLVVNHSGQLPWDGAMLGTGVLLEHPNQRLVRTLYATWFPTLPFFSDLLVKLGQVLATEDNGIRLLEQDELTAVYPEGYKGVGKLYKDRYRLARFGRGGFVRMALKTRAPIIPVAIVGAEETYISLTKSNLMSKLTGFPYFPISPTFPWLGLLGFVPLPTKWFIDIGEPIPMDSYAPNAEQNLMLVSQITDQVRNIVQDMIFARLSKRRSVFFG